MNGQLQAWQGLVIILSLWTIVGLIMWRCYVYSRLQMRTKLEIAYLVICGAAAWLSMYIAISRMGSRRKQRAG